MSKFIYYSKFWIVILFVWTISLSSAKGQEETVYNVKNYGAKGDGISDDYQAFASAINAAIAGIKPCTVFIPEGKYFIATSPNRGIIELNNCRKVTIQGEGELKSLIISGDPTKDMIHIRNSNNITVSKLELDRNPFVFTQGMIDKIDIGNRTVEVTVDNGYDEPDSKYLQILTTLLVFTDSNTYVYDHSRWPPQIQKKERIAPMKWRLTLNVAPLANYVDKPFVIWDNKYKGWGVNCVNSFDCFIEDVRYYGGGADAGIGVWNCTGKISFKNFYVGVPENSGRLFAAAGGGQQFNNRCTFIMDGCDISRVDDDGYNMGTNYLRVIEQINSKTISAERQGVLFSRGDTITLWDWRDKKERAQAIITGLDTSKDGEVRLTLDRDVQILHPWGIDKIDTSQGRRDLQEVDGIDRIANFNSVGQSIIRNCQFQNMRARCVLVKNSNTLIENNVFHNTHMTAILVGPEFYWGEAPQVRNLIIRDNRFINIDGSSINIACFNSENSMDNKNILIENNSFVNYGAKGGTSISGKQGTAVLVRNSDGVKILNNTFEPSQAAISMKAPPILVEVSKNVIMEGNIIKDGTSSEINHVNNKGDTPIHISEAGYISLSDPSSKAELKIFNITGQTVFTETFINLSSFSLHTLEKGTYIIYIKQKNEYFSQKYLKH